MTSRRTATAFDKNRHTPRKSPTKRQDRRKRILRGADGVLSRRSVPIFGKQKNAVYGVLWGEEKRNRENFSKNQIPVILSKDNLFLKFLFLYYVGVLKRTNGTVIENKWYGQKEQMVRSSL